MSVLACVGGEVLTHHKWSSKELLYVTGVLLSPTANMLMWIHPAFARHLVHDGCEQDQVGKSHQNVEQRVSAVRKSLIP